MLSLEERVHIAHRSQTPHSACVPVETSRSAVDHSRNPVCVTFALTTAPAQSMTSPCVVRGSAAANCAALAPGVQPPAAVAAARHERQRALLRSRALPPATRRLAGQAVSERSSSSSNSSSSRRWRIRRAANPTTTCQLTEEPSLDIYGSSSARRERSSLESVGYWAAAPLRLLVPGADLANRLGVTLLIICLARVGHFIPIAGKPAASRSPTPCAVATASEAPAAQHTHMPCLSLAEQPGAKCPLPCSPARLAVCLLGVPPSNDRSLCVLVCRRGVAGSQRAGRNGVPDGAHRGCSQCVCAGVSKLLALSELSPGGIPSLLFMWAQLCQPH